MGTVGRHASDGVALVQRFAPGQHVGAEEAQVLDGPLGQVRQLPGGFRPVGRGHHRVNARQRLGGAGIYGLDHRVGMGTAEYLAVEQAGQIGVGAVAGPARHLVGAVRPDRPGTDHVELFVGEHDVRLVVQHVMSPEFRFGQGLATRRYGITIAEAL